MDRRLANMVTRVRHALFVAENGFADLLLVAMLAFMLAVLVTGHRIVVQ